MSYVSAALFERSINELKAHHSLLVISILKMLQEQYPAVGTQAEADANHKPFGTPQEKEFLDAHFRYSGGPEGKPWFNPSGGGQWVDDRYPGRSLQRQKDDYSRKGIFFKTKSGSEVGYQFRNDFASGIAEKLLPAPDSRLPVLAVGAWLYWDKPFETVTEIVDFTVEFLHLDRDGLLETVFSTAVSPEDEADGLTAEPLKAEEISGLIDAAPVADDLALDLASFISDIEAKMLARHVILPERLVERMVRAWVTGEIVVLVGAPGTGKTLIAHEFAQAVGQYLATDSVMIPVQPDTDVTTVVGYENLAGDYVDSDFSAKILRTNSPFHPHIVRIEEWNLAQPETYLSPLLHAVEGREAISLGQEAHSLPIDTLVIATCNSVRDEPETRLPVSRASKQRAVVIEVPNVLARSFDQGGREGVSSEADELLGRKQSEVEARINEGRKTAFDALRLASLEKYSSLGEFDEVTVSVLLDLSEVLLSDVGEGRRVLTARLLADILFDLAVAGSHSALALGDQVTGKVLQQVTSVPLARAVADASAPLSNHGEIVQAVDALEAAGHTGLPLI